MPLTFTPFESEPFSTVKNINLGLNSISNQTKYVFETTPVREDQVIQYRSPQNQWVLVQGSNDWTINANELHGRTLGNVKTKQNIFISAQAPLTLKERLFLYRFTFSTASGSLQERLKQATKQFLGR
ncbi:MAG: hypothetical protein VKJ06_04245 [Vampirovibrionales bacterium]|nr:hypothetical protein [Vampirovibrionales bacterium]